MSRKNILVMIGAGVLVISAFAFAYIAYRFYFCEEIKGRVLIVQRNADVKRLALIKVYAISRAQANEWKSAVVENVRKISAETRVISETSSDERRRLIVEHDAIILSLQKMLGMALESRDDSRDFWIVNPNQPTKKNRFFERVALSGFPSGAQLGDFAISSRWDKCFEVLRNSVVPELESRLTKAEERKVSALKQHDGDFSEKIRELKAQHRRAISFDTLTEIPSSVEITASGISDDNGEFSVRLSVGDYFLIARGTRHVGDSKEEYFWAHPVSVPSDESRKCLMGNNNMLDGSDRHLWSDLGTKIQDQLTEK